MTIYFSLILLLISCLSYKKSKTVLAPTVISTASWGGVLLLFSLFGTSLYPLSVSCLWVIMLWNVSLYCGAFLFSYTNIVSAAPQGLHFYNWVRKVYFYISIIGSIPTLYITLKSASAAGFADLSYSLRMVNTGLVETEYSLGVFSYVYTFAYISFMIELFSAVSGEDNKKKLFLIGVVNIAFSVVTVSKSSFFFLLIASMVLFSSKMKITLKKNIIIGIVLVTIMFAVQSSRNGAQQDAGDIVTELFSGYVLSGIPAFDQIQNSGMTSKVPGQYTLAFFDNMKRKMGINVPKEKECNNDITEYGYLYTPFPTNVYTVIGPFWLDYGCKGIIIISFIIGSLSGYFYKLFIRKNKWGTIVYAYLYCVLALQFFGEYIFTNLSYLIQLIILSILACKFKYIIKW